MESERNFGYRVGYFLTKGAFYTGAGILGILWFIISVAFTIAATLLANWLLATGAELAFDAGWWWLGWPLRLAQLGSLLYLFLFVGGIVFGIGSMLVAGLWEGVKALFRLPVVVFQRLTGRSLWVVRLTASEFVLLDMLTGGAWEPAFRNRIYMSDESVVMIGKKNDCLALNDALMVALEKMLMSRDFDPANVPVIASTGLKLRIPADTM
jgi:hypothetical protein